MKKATLHIILFVIMPIFFCGSIYILTRPNNLVMFQWLRKFGIFENIIKLRRQMSLNSLLPNWIIFNLPALVWSFSFTMLLGIIWGYNIKKDNFIILLIPTVLGVLLELSQSIKLINGTFDYIDLILYLIGGLTGLILVKLINFKSKPHQS